MKKITLLSVLFILIWASSAGAHGPVRQKMSEKITINAAPEVVWGHIKEFGDMHWLPEVEKTTSEGGNTEGATRVLTLKAGGGTITEELKKYDSEKMSYKYKITTMSTSKTIQHSGKEEVIPALPVNNQSAKITVKAKGDGSEVSWKAGYYRAYLNNKPPEEMNEETANSAVKAILKSGLESLKKLSEGSGNASSQKSDTKEEENWPVKHDQQKNKAPSAGQEHTP